MRPDNLLSCLVLLFAGGWAQLAAQEVVQVVDANGRGIPGVAVVSPDGMGHVTDGAGEVELDTGTAWHGEWVLRCLGFVDRNLDGAALFQGSPIRLEEAVLDLPQALVEAVSLTAGRPMGVPGAVTVLSAKALRRHGDVDVSRALRSVPGVYVQEEDGFGLRPNIGLRGSGSERSSRISILEDGVPIAPAPYTAPSAYYFPSVGRMSGIEVMKGASQIAHGPNTVGGAINLISTPIPAALSGRVDGRMGSFGTGRLHVHVGDGSGRIGWMVEALQAGSQGFKVLDGGGPTGFDKLDLMGKLRWRSAEDARHDQRLELKLGAVSELSHETYAGLIADDFEQSPYRRYAGSHRDRMDAAQRQAVLTHVLDLGSGWRWTQRAYATRFERNWYKADRAAGLSGSWVKLGSLLNPIGLEGADSTVLEALSVFRDGADCSVRLKANNRIYHSRGVETKLAWDGRWHGWRRVEGSLRLHGDGMDRFQWVDDWTMAAGQLVDADRGTPGTESNRIEWSRAVAGYVRGRWARNGWSVLPGVRSEYILAGRDDYGTADVDRTGVALQTRRNVTVAWLPGVGIQKDLGAEWSVFGGVHRGFLPPGSSEEVQPEFAWNHEAGMRWVRPRMDATAVLFAHLGRNLQGSDFASSGGSSDGTVYNGGTTRVSGLEAQVNWTNGANPEEVARWECGLTYTFTDGRFMSAFESDYDAWGQVEVGDVLPYLARHQGAVRMAWSRAGWSVDAAARHQEGMRTEAGQAALDDVLTVGGSTVVDFTARRGLANGLALELGVRNLMDAVYVASARPAGLRPGMPRIITGGFNLSF